VILIILTRKILHPLPVGLIINMKVRHCEYSHQDDSAPALSRLERLHSTAEMLYGSGFPRCVGTSSLVNMAPLLPAAWPSIESHRTRTISVSNPLLAIVITSANR